jgi:lactate dehydrogenase-like 2-hydroxyacid dehydrogenase
MSDAPPPVLAIAALPEPVARAAEALFALRRASPDLAGLTPADLAGVRGLITGGATGAGAELIGRLPALEIIAVNGVGVDKVDLGAARARGVRVTNTPDVLTDDVADLAVGLLIALARRICAGDTFVRAGRWAAGETLPLARSLRSLRVGIVGLGRIGEAVARRLEPMVAGLAYYNRAPRPERPYAYSPSLLALAQDSDVLIVAVSGGTHSHQLVGREALQALGPTGLLVNVARGSVIDEAALVAALRDGRLGGAALDVFADEPRAPAALFDLPNVVLQPHVGSATVETRLAMGRLVLDNLAAHFAGRPPLTPVA